MFSRATKTLLRNHIRHTTTHNKILEEGDMWRLHEEQKQRKRESGKRGAHMDEMDDRRFRDSTPESPMRSRESTPSKKETFWMKRLQEAEEKYPDRWGHAGYKELHPEEFNSSLSDSSDSETRNVKKKKKKKSKKEKKKREKKSKKKKRHKRERDSGSDSDSDNSDSNSDKRKTKKKSKKHKKDSSSLTPDSDVEVKNVRNGHRKTKKRKYETESDSLSDSEDSYVESKKRRKFTSERTDSDNPEIKSSKHKKKSKHKKSSPETKTHGGKNGVVWIEKTS